MSEFKQINFYNPMKPLENQTVQDFQNLEEVVVLRKSCKNWGYQKGERGGRILKGGSSFFVPSFYDKN